jgi:NAD(P)-dependent dehydrogenase (short-subunit alcohol dehydrogenase family)
MELIVNEDPMPVDGDGPRRSVVVTGASTGIGLAAAQQLAWAGHMVVLGDRRTEICEKVAAELRAEGATAFAAALDLSDPSSIDRFVESARYLVGPVEVLVSDAGQFGTQHLAACLIPAMVVRPGHTTDDVARVVASVINCSQRTHLRLVEVIPSVPRTVEATN